MRVAVVGASSLRNLLLRDLAEEPRVGSVVQVDGFDLTQFEDAQVVLGCWDAEADREQKAAEAALMSGIPYVSCSVSLENFQALSDLERVPESGLVIKSMSFSPGITNLMVKLASRELDSVDTIKVSWSALRPSRSLLAQAHRSSRDAVVFEAGNWQLEPAGSAEEEVYFPQPLGWRKVRLFAGAEVLSIPHSVPGLERMYVKGDFGSTLDKASVRGRSIAGMGWSAVRVDSTGKSKGSSQTVTYGLVDETNSAMVAPAIAAATLAAEAKTVATGVLAPEEALDPVDFFSRLAQRGIRLAKLTPSQPLRAA